MKEAVLTRTAPARDLLIFGSALKPRGGVAAAGALWMPWQRRGDFQRVWRTLREAHGGPSQVRWRTVRRKYLPFYLALVDAFFAQRWLGFRAVVDLAAVGNHRERALATLVQHAFVHGGRGTRHRVRVERTLTATEVMPDALAVHERDAPALQIARLFTALVRAAHRGVRGAARRELAAALAVRLGVKDLASAGAPAGGRFQVWLPGELGSRARTSADA